MSRSCLALALAQAQAQAAVPIKKARSPHGLEKCSAVTHIERLAKLLHMNAWHQKQALENRQVSVSCCQADSIVVVRCRDPCQNP